MHIPDGYLSPRSAGALWVVSAPLWALSLRAIRRRVDRRRVPLVALLSAFSFLVMMFNIPLPGGTTAHAVGAVLVAILVGPWAALTSVTLALAFAAGAGGYVGINAAALLAAVELGLQPVLHHLPDGTPLYCPFPLAVTIPAMTIPHLTVAGAAEAILTGGVVAFLGRHHAELFETGEGPMR